MSTDLKIIDLNRIREGLPNRAVVRLDKTDKGTPYINCQVSHPHLSEEDFEECKQWQREIIGKENIMEFNTNVTGGNWSVYLERNPYEFLNTTDTDIKSFTKIDLNQIKSTE